MLLNFRGRRLRRTRSNKKNSGESQNHLTPEQVRAGTGVVRTYADWQALFKDSEVGRVLGVSHLFTEAEEE